MQVKLSTKGEIKYADGTTEEVGLEFAGTIKFDPADADNPFELILSRIGQLDAKQSRLVHLLRESLATALVGTVTPPKQTGADHADS